MARKVFTILLVLAVLAVGTGFAGFVHASESHEALGDSHCQVCFMLAASVVALAFVAALLLFFVADSSTAIPWFNTLPLINRHRLTPCAPRAPPLH